MRVNYLIGGFGHTGGSLVLYKFMDKLCERGHEVRAITPNSSLKWRKGSTRVLLARLSSVPKPGQEEIEALLSDTGMGASSAEWAAGCPTPFQGKSLAGRRRPGQAAWVQKTIRRYRRKLAHKLIGGELADLESFTRGLLDNWVPAEVTIATFCLTAYAAYALMDQTIPLYHMQHFEELMFESALSSKAARLTYYMPLTLMANSSWLRSQIANRIGRDSLLLNPGIDLEVFHPRGDLAKKYARGNGRIKVVSYYSPVKFKAWDDAVEAMREVCKTMSPAKVEWVVFGGQPKKTPDVPVTFVGAVFGENLARLYSSAHIVFMNSWYESFPLPPLEAMACGTAVVTTRLGTEDYAFDGKNSLVVPPRETHQLANAIIKLIEDPTLAAHLAHAGFETARQFSWDNAAIRLEEIIQRAVASHRSQFRDIPALTSGRFS